MAEVAFRSHHNAFLAVKEGHLSSDLHADVHSKFIITHKHHHSTLQNHYGRFLGVDGEGVVHMRDDGGHESTHWVLEHVHGGKVALKTHGGLYVALDHEHKVRLTPERHADALFEEVHV